MPLATLVLDVISFGVLLLRQIVSYAPFRTAAPRRVNCWGRCGQECLEHRTYEGAPRLCGGCAQPVVRRGDRRRNCRGPSPRLQGPPRSGDGYVNFRMHDPEMYSGGPPYGIGSDIPASAPEATTSRDRNQGLRESSQIQGTCRRGRCGDEGASPVAWRGCTALATFRATPRRLLLRVHACLGRLSHLAARIRVA